MGWFSAKCPCHPFPLQHRLKSYRTTSTSTETSQRVPLCSNCNHQKCFSCHVVQGQVNNRGGVCLSSSANAALGRAMEVQNCQSNAGKAGIRNSVSAGIYRPAAELAYCNEMAGKHGLRSSASAGICGRPTEMSGHHRDRNRESSHSLEESLHQMSFSSNSDTQLGSAAYVDKKNNREIYTNFNPAYKSTTPPEECPQDCSAHGSSATHYACANVTDINLFAEKPDLLRHRVQSSTSASRLEELFYRGHGAKSRSPRSSWCGPSGYDYPVPNPPPPPSRKLPSPFTYLNSPPKSPLSQSPTPPFATPPCSPLTVDHQCHGVINPNILKIQSQDVRPKTKIPSPSVTPKNQSPRNSWNSDSCESGGSTPVYWELEETRNAPSPLKHVDPDLKTTPLRHSGRKEKPRMSAGEEGVRLRNSKSSSQIQKSSSKSKLNGKGQATTANKATTTLCMDVQKEKSTHKVQVWIPPAQPKPKVKPKPKAKLDAKSQTSRMRTDSDSSVSSVDISVNTLPLKSPRQCNNEGCRGKKSQSCEHICASAKCEKDTRCPKHRRATPPRVLSPSLENMSCEVIADI